MRSMPFSTERHASPEMFFGYSGTSSRPPGGWKLEEIVGCWLQSTDGPPSFWAVGERKLGKTSLLVRLEDLLNSQRGEAPRLPVPLLLSCKGVADIAGFYRQLFERAAQTLAGREQALELDELMLFAEGNGPATALELFERARADLGRLVAQLSPEGSPRARLILLVDDAGSAVERGWAKTLFEHLRVLLRGCPTPCSDDAFGRDDVAVVIAAERGIERADGARGLLDLVEELPLHTLDLNEVATLIGESFKRFRRSWPHRIYSATAGHPWLVHFVMERIVASGANDVQEQEPDLDAIVKTQFRAFKDGVSIFRLYLDSLMDRSVEILAHLAMKGSTADDLAAKTKLSIAAVARRLEQMLNLGIVYQTPGDAADAQCRYFLGDIFKQWFIAHTGSNVLLSEIEVLRSSTVTAQKAVLNAPFTLTLGIDPEFVLVDGLYTRLVPVGPRFPQNLRNITALTRNEAAKGDLDLVADELKEALQQSNWEAVWNDYVDHSGADARFVLRVANPDLFQLPIELLPINGRPLALERPVYKELMAGQREPAYRLCGNLLSPETELNVLLIGSGRKGIYEERQYDELPLVATEIAEIAASLRAKSTGRRLKIGRVAAVVEPDVNLPKGVDRLQLSTANVARALRGELGGPFHVLHYCGHYIHNRDKSAGGFLLHDGESLKLFNLAEWYHTLNQQTPLRLVCLSACDSAGHRQDPDLYHLGAAREALQCGVPVVIGMRWSIRDSRALEFSRAFYPQLLEFGVPEVALWKTRRALNEKEPGNSLWAAPVMLTR